jgi:hypothetical protein
VYFITLAKENHAGHPATGEFSPSPSVKPEEVWYSTGMDIRKPHQMWGGSMPGAIRFDNNCAITKNTNETTK